MIMAEPIKQTSQIIYKALRSVGLNVKRVAEDYDPTTHNVAYLADFGEGFRVRTPTVDLHDTKYETCIEHLVKFIAEEVQRHQKSQLPWPPNMGNTIRYIPDRPSKERTATEIKIIEAMMEQIENKKVKFPPYLTDFLLTKPEEPKPSEPTIEQPTKEPLPKLPTEY